MGPDQVGVVVASEDLLGRNKDGLWIRSAFEPAEKTVLENGSVPADSWKTNYVQAVSWPEGTRLVGLDIEPVLIVLDEKCLSRPVPSNGAAYPDAMSKGSVGRVAKQAANGPGWNGEWVLRRGLQDFKVGKVRQLQGETGQLIFLVKLGIGNAAY